MLSLHVRRLSVLTVLLLAVFLPTVSASENIQIKGSDTMVNLGQAWVEAFMEIHPDVSIAVTGGGSGTGIAAILSGSCDIAQSSRAMTAEEKAKADTAGRAVKETEVAYDGIVVVVNKNNPVSQLTTDQLADIFSGKIHNWKEVGGNDQSILVLSRERNSGTHVFFLEHVVRRGNAKGPEEFAPSALMMPSSQAIVEEVKSSDVAIGYVGLGYADEEEKIIAVGKSAEGPYLLPSVETVLSSEYPIARPLYFYTDGEPQGSIKTFADFVLSPEGQEIVEALDFVPLKK